MSLLNFFFFFGATSNWPPLLLVSVDAAAAISSESQRCPVRTHPPFPLPLSHFIIFAGNEISIRLKTSLPFCSTYFHTHIRTTKNSGGHHHHRQRSGARGPLFIKTTNLWWMVLRDLQRNQLHLWHPSWMKMNAWKKRSRGCLKDYLPTRANLDPRTMPAKWMVKYPLNLLNLHWT